MNEVKYQIFISSTYEDLKEERDQVIKACLEIGHIPVGMEMFSAADEEQWKIITRQIDDSDYFLVIIAYRYGSVLNEISYTEKEYDYAVSKGIPTLGFIIDGTANWAPERIQMDKKSVKKLNFFKKKIQSKPVNYWKNKDELHAQCVIALGKTINAQRRPGWIRPSRNVMSQINNFDNIEINMVNNGGDKDIAALKAENARLQFEIFKLKNDLIYITYPTDKESVSRIILVEGFVKNINSKIWPIVRSVGGYTYWVQSLAEVDSNGKWRAKVIIGGEGNVDFGARYELAIFANPQIELNIGDELKEWPMAEFKSEIIEIIRK